MRGTYAIGDIHGHLDKLIAIQERIAAHMEQNGIGHAKIVYLGDYVDRGPNSRGVIEHLMTVPLGNVSVFLPGNHEAMFAAALGIVDLPDNWAHSWVIPGNGGAACLASYGTDLSGKWQVAIPASHKAWLQRIVQGPVWHKDGDDVFVHAGLIPGAQLERNQMETCLWIRDWFLDDYDGPFRVIHGHTPADEPEHEQHRINIDTGAAHGGPVSAVALIGDRVEFLSSGA